MQFNTRPIALSKDNCCALGRWLHGEAKAQFGKAAAYGDCVARHADFHREAGKVAAAINATDFDRASKMLEAGTPYAKATSAVGSAILGLKKSIAA
jgi:methyl-accepting chemotaxis protein